MSHFSKTLIKFAVVLLIVNIVGIWMILFLDHRRVMKLQELTNTPGKEVPKEMKKVGDDTVDERLGTVEKTQKGFNTRLDQLESSFSASQNLPVRTVVKTNNAVNSQNKKEYTVYLGEGSTISTDWVAVQSTTIALDTNKYPGLSTVYFEAALSTNGGEAYAQLVDAETGAIFSSPALVHNTPTPTWKTAKINLSPGTHTYVVQIKSSSGETVTLSGARLRIQAN